MNQAQIDPKIEPSWKEVLWEDFQKESFVQLKYFLKEEKSKGKKIYPPGSLIFNALDKCPFYDVKVVILGQDPYHGPGQAHGLCFSVPENIPFPPSLMNIFKEIGSDLSIPYPKKGNLEKWSSQGVLLLNASLTVEAGKAGSHFKRGWEPFTDSIINKLSEKREGLIFLLWGKFARDKACLIDSRKHHILTAPHPSPLSASRGFFGCRHFSKTNEILGRMGKSPIDWSI